MRGDVALFPFTYKCLCPYSLMNLMYHKFKKIWLNNKLRSCLKIHYRSIKQAYEHELGTFHTECPSSSTTEINYHILVDKFRKILCHDKVKTTRTYQG